MRNVNFETVFLFHKMKKINKKKKNHSDTPKFTL